MSSYVEVWLMSDSMKSVDFDIGVSSGGQAPVNAAAACAIIPMGRA